MIPKVLTTRADPTSGPGAVNAGRLAPEMAAAHRAVMLTRAHRNVLIIQMVGVAVTIVFLGWCWWYAANVDHPMRACKARDGGIWNAQTHICRIAPDVTCEQNGGWWDPMSKSCARVVSVPAFTGKPISPPK